MYGGDNDSQSYVLTGNQHTKTCTNSMSVLQAASWYGSGKLKNASFGQKVRSLQLCQTFPNLAAVKLVTDGFEGPLHAVLLHQGIGILMISLLVLRTHLMLLWRPSTVV